MAEPKPLTAWQAIDQLSKASRTVFPVSFSESLKVQSAGKPNDLEGYGLFKHTGYGTDREKCTKRAIAAGQRFQETKMAAARTANKKQANQTLNKTAKQKALAQHTFRQKLQAMSRRGGFIIKVKTMSGAILPIRLTQDVTVLELKGMLEKLVHVPRHCQSLLFQRKRLNDHDFISNSEIHDGEYLFLAYTGHSNTWMVDKPELGRSERCQPFSEIPPCQVWCRRTPRPNDVSYALFTNKDVDQTARAQRQLYSRTYVIEDTKKEKKKKNENKSKNKNKNKELDTEKEEAAVCKRRIARRASVIADGIRARRGSIAI
jgi:hypothetical protein